MTKVTKPVAQPGLKPRQEKCYTFNHYIILSHSNVGELMGVQRNGKLFQKGQWYSWWVCCIDLSFLQLQTKVIQSGSILLPHSPKNTPLAPIQTSDLQTSCEMNTQQILQVSTVLHIWCDQGPCQTSKIKKKESKGES